jgi:hypothetical protein
MIPPSLGELWTPKMQRTTEKIAWHAIPDLVSTVSAISKELYDKLDIGALEKYDIDLYLDDTSTKHVSGRVTNIIYSLITYNICAYGF